MSELNLSDTSQELQDGLLDDNDPFDKLVLDFRDQSEQDGLPTQAEDRAMIVLLREREWDSAGMFLQSHKGFIAAVAYPFKPSVPSRELIVAGARAFLAAAKTYDLDGKDAFSDYSIVAMRRLLAESYPEAAIDPEDLYPEHPTQSLLHQVAGLTRKSEAEAAIRKEQAKRKLATLSEAERGAIPYIHLPGADVDNDEAIPYSGARISDHVYNVVNNLGLGGRGELALLALEAGVRYRIPAPENMDGLGVRQRMVAGRVHKSNEEIGIELSLSTRQVAWAVRNLFADTPARTRTELLLMAHMHDFEPSEQELYVHTHEAMQQFTEFQRPLIALSYLRTEDIMGRTDLSKRTVNDSINHATTKLGLSGRNARTALALKLHDQGFKFDIWEPLQPLSEIFSARDLRIGHLAALPNAEIAQAEMEISGESGISAQDVNRWMHNMQSKTGARTRAELALQIRIHDTGESRTPRPHEMPRDERFFSEIGVEPVPMERALGWLAHTTPRQREYLEALYFTEDRLSLNAVAHMFSVTRGTIITTTQRGFRNIRQGLAE